MISKAVMEALMDMVPKDNIHIEEPLAAHTTFRVGGPADCLVEIESTEQLRKIQKYLRLIEQQNKEKEKKQNLTEEELKRQAEVEAEKAELAAAEAASELNQKLSAPIVVQVNEQPKMPEGFGKKQSKKKKYTPSQSLEETTVDGEGVVEPVLPSSEELDGEYFDWKDEQEGNEKQAKKGGKKFFGKR